MAADPATTAALNELIAVVERLRDPEGGCPWDLEQTHTSLVPYVLEEAHEVADAIRHGDDAHLAEELGDLRMQHHLQQQVAQLFFEVAVIAVADRISYLMGFLEHVGHQGGVGLPQIPGTAALRVAQLGHHSDQLAQRCGGFGRGCHRFPAQASAPPSHSRPNRRLRSAGSAAAALFAPQQPRQAR